MLCGTIANNEIGLGESMDGWKKALVLGSIGAAGILFMKKKYPAGVLATGVGLAVLAAEYPEKFERVRQLLPDYFEQRHALDGNGRASRQADYRGGRKKRGGIVGRDWGMKAASGFRRLASGITSIS